MTINIKEKLVTEFCKAWNNLDISYIEKYIADDFEYTSQMVLETIYGKDAYVKYLKCKFIAIEEGNDPVKAELGYFDNTPCLILIQHLATPEKAVYSKRKQLSDGTIENVPVFTNERAAIVLYKFDDAKIKSAVICMIAPNINDVKRTGIYPK